jgi:hypothetical protein
MIWCAGRDRVDVLWPSRQASWMAYFALYSSKAATDMVTSLCLEWRGEEVGELELKLEVESEFRIALA